jgi:stress response protein YsnF
LARRALGKNEGMPPQDDAITRSEEELHHAGTQVRPVRRVRFAKRIVTDYVEVRVPLRREELHVYEEEIADGVAEPGELALDDDTLVMVLHAEEAIGVRTRVVPRERVRVHLDVVGEERTVATELRREVIELEETPPRW